MTHPGVVARLLLDPTPVAATDRAFRALARADPAAVLALIRAAVPGLLAGSRIDATSVEDPALDLPPPVEADLVARAGDGELLHVEGQGYRDGAFDARVFRYHLALVLRHPGRSVTTVALWLTRPPESMRLDVIEQNGVSIRVTSVVLSEIPASSLLASPETVCFAPGADAEERTDEQLCEAVARALREQNARWQRLLLAVTVAAAQGRYDAMISAMHQEELEPPIIEDLVRFGRDRGIEIGRGEGIEIGRDEGRHQEARDNLLEVLELRGLALSAEERARIDSEASLEQLRVWLRRAVRAGSMRDVFEQPLT